MGKAEGTIGDRPKKQLDFNPRKQTRKGREKPNA